VWLSNPDGIAAADGAIYVAAAGAAPGEITSPVACPLEPVRARVYGLVEGLTSDSVG